MAFMLEADNFNPWIEVARGYLTHPIWTADPKNKVFGEAAKRSLTAGGLGSVGEKRRPRSPTSWCSYVRQLLPRHRGREGLDRDRGTAVKPDYR